VHNRCSADGDYVKTGVVAASAATASTRPPRAFHGSRTAGR